MPRLLSVTNPASEKVSYRYDAAGRLKAIVDAKTHETSFDYDELGRVTKKTLASGAFEQFGYDSVTGNKTSHRLADGNTNTFKYDLMNRVSEVKYYDIATTYLVTYTANGLRSQVSDDRGLTSYSYNRRDLLTSYVQPVKDGANFFSQRVDYTYNQAGNRSSVETFMGASGVPSTSVSYGYDNAYQLLNVTQSGVATATTYAYDDLGRRTNVALGNNVQVNYGYDSLNRLTSLVQFKSATNIASYTYYYTATNPFGNANLRTGLVETKNGSTTANYTWDYDQAFRVTTETLQAGSTITTTGFGYDGAGNRTEWRQKVGAGATTSVTYQVDELDKLLSTNNGVSGGEIYSYNGRGNLIQIKQNGTVQKSFTWDGADRLVSVVAGGSSNLATFKYDFDGRRIQQQITTTTATHSLWDITTRYGDVLLETSYSGATPNSKVSYTYASSPVAELISQKKGASTPEYFLLDGQGSVRGLTDISGVLVNGSEFSYDTFGKLTAGDTTKSSYLYTGQQYDSVSQLYDLRARYYSPQQGRFLSRDTWPVGYKNPTELNRYGYTANNPVNGSDPSGNTTLASNGLSLKFAALGVLGIGIYFGSQVKVPIEDIIGAQLMAASKVWWEIIIGIMGHVFTNNRFSKPAVALGFASIKGERKLILTASNFWGNAETALPFALAFALAKLFIGSAFYRVEGGIFEATSGHGQNRHAEEVMRDTLIEEFNLKNLDPGSTTFVGVSKDDICDVCMGLGTSMSPTPFGIKWFVPIDGRTGTSAIFFGLMRGGPRSI